MPQNLKNFIVGSDDGFLFPQLSTRKSPHLTWKRQTMSSSKLQTLATGDGPGTGPSDADHHGIGRPTNEYVLVRESLRFA